MKALVIDEPWISLILSGEKTWEMRNGNCNIRGTIARIRKGSGTVVGTAQIVGSLPELDSLESYAEAESFHRIPAERRQQAFAGGWRTPWVLAGVRQMIRPIPYSHPKGAVIWVALGPAIATQIDAQDAWDESGPSTIASPATLSVVAARNIQVSAPPALAPRIPASGSIEYVTLTQGNLNNKHIYLAGIISLFPEEAIGGRNSDFAARKSIQVTFAPGSTVDTDIDGTKKILRGRGPVGDFLARSGAVAGDVVAVHRTSPYSFTFSLHRPT